MFSLFVSVLFVVISAITPPSLPSIIYEDGGIVFTGCSVASLADSWVRIISADSSAVFDNSPDSPVHNALDSWESQCSWRVIGPDGLGLGALFPLWHVIAHKGRKAITLETKSAYGAEARKSRKRRIWLANPTPQCGQYNLTAYPTARDAVSSLIADGVRPEREYNYWPITEDDTTPEDWADYVEECASY